jgi:aspartyl-tRNA(Asn)/glutamyl-tRNA(Gln) amidotransferase subunit A
MAGPDLHWLTVTEASKLLQTRQVSAAEILEDTLEWVKKTDPITRNFAYLAEKEAREEASRADEEIGRGNYRGPLHGIPYTVKALISVAGAPMAWNSKVYANWSPKKDAEVVRRTREAGGVLLGKVHTHEFAWGVTTPPTRNPWDGRSVTGGSSGGSGSSIAAGQGMGSWGTDCGCSVRNPSALNGCAGMRVTQGRVPASGVVPLSLTMDTVGPLARTVRDLGLMLNGVAGYDPNDHFSADAPTMDFTAKLGRDIKGMKLGVPNEYFFDHMEPGVKRLVEDGIGQLAKLGMDVREVKFPHVKYTAGTFIGIVVAESAANHDEWLNERAAELGIDVRNFTEMGNLLLAKDYIRSNQIRTLIRQDFLDAFRDVDVIVTPTVAATAKPPTDHPIFINVQYPDGFSEDVIWAYCRFTMPMSLASTPCCIVPCGFSDDGMPTALQIAAKPYDEATALQVGFAYEQSTDWHTKRPSIGQ